MLQRVKDLKKCGISATDGDIGRVVDVYFDDRRWTVRYLVVDTGTWLASRQVLISPYAVGRLVPEDDMLTVRLTRRQVEESPDVETHKPVSRQFEEAYARYYGYPLYWGGSAVWGTSAYPTEAGLSVPPVEPAMAEEAPVLEALGEINPEDFTLRSCNDVAGYRVEATNGEIGHVEDFLVDSDSWQVRYLVIDTTNWWFGGHVIISPDWVDAVVWADSKIVVDLTREAIRNAPPYDPDRLPDADAEARLRRHYGFRPSSGDGA